MYDSTVTLLFMLFEEILFSTIISNLCHYLAYIILQSCFNKSALQYKYNNLTSQQCRIIPLFG